MTPITISGVGSIDADVLIDNLVQKIAALELENAALRACVSVWMALAHANVADEPPRPSESPTEADPGNGNSSNGGAPTVVREWNQMSSGQRPQAP